MTESSHLTGQTHAMRLIAIRVNISWSDWEKYLGEKRKPASFAFVAHSKPFDRDDEYSTRDLGKAFWLSESDFKKSPEGFPEIQAQLFLKNGAAEFDNSLYSLAYKRETMTWHWVFRNSKLPDLDKIWERIEKEATKTKADARVNQMGVYQMTKPFGKPWGGYTVHTWLLPTVRGYFDAHMHIQSNRCVALPLVWDKLPGKIEPGWGFMESWVASKAAGPELTNTGKMSSDLVGYKALNELPMATNQLALGAAADIYHPKTDHFLTPLMMDLEYGHVRGYDGFPIYEKGPEGKIGWRPNPEKPDFFSEIDLSEVKKMESFPVQFLLTKSVSCSSAGAWKMLPYFHYDPRRWNPIPKNKESFRKDFLQGSFLKTATGIPELKSWMDTVDPEKNFDSIPLEWLIGLGSKTSSIKAPFIGVKLYSSLGYRPDDFHRLPNLDTLYSYCLKHDIPVMNHCTDEGMYTHQRRFYYNFLRNDPEFKKVAAIEDLLKQFNELEQKFVTGNNGSNVKGYDSQIRQLANLGKEIDEACSNWFIDHFIHPTAWENVVTKYPQLKVCLAHFADSGNFNPKHGGFIANGSEIDPKSSSWLVALFKLIRQNNQIHSDLSYVIFDEENWPGFDTFFRWAKEHRPWLLDRILWGSDWFMIGKSGVDSPMIQNYNKDNFKYLMRLEFGLELWIRFAYINPVRFLNLKKRAANIEKALDVPAPEWIAKMPDTWEDYLKMHGKPF